MTYQGTPIITLPKQPVTPFYHTQTIYYTHGYGSVVSMPTAEVKDPACPCQRCASAPLVCLLASVVTAARERRADPASRIGTAFPCFDLRRWAAYRPADDRGREPQPADDIEVGT